MTKTLTQDDFKQPSCPRWVASAAVDGGGIAWGFQLTSEELEVYCQRWVHPYGLCVLLGTEYDTTNWQHSAIDRE